MLQEFVATSTSGPTGSSNPKGATAQIIPVDNPLHPAESFKNCPSITNGLAISGSHIFTAQKDKAVVFVYSRQRQNQETLASFPERVTCLKFIGDRPNGGVGTLVVGTEGGRIVLWEVATGRQVFGTPSHIQKVTCIDTSPDGLHILTGSADATINVWSLLNLVSFVEPQEDAFLPIQTLSAHQAAVTCLAVGHSPSPQSNLAVSGSADRTCLTWNYHSGAILHKVSLSQIPTCITLDPADRAFFLGFGDGSLAICDYYTARGPAINVLSRTTEPSAIELEEENRWTARGVEDVGAVTTLALLYDGSKILSGHESGKILRWNVLPTDAYDKVLLTLDHPVSCVVPLPVEMPSQKEPVLKLSHVVKPKADGPADPWSRIPLNYTVTAQLGGIADTPLNGTGRRRDIFEEDFPPELLTFDTDDTKPESNNADEIEELKKELAEARATQARTQEQYGKLQTEHSFLLEKEASRARREKRKEK